MAAGFPKKAEASNYVVSLKLRNAFTSVSQCICELNVTSGDYLFRSPQPAHKRKQRNQEGKR